MGSKGIIGILTGGGDVPGLNPAIRGVTLRAIREGYEVVGIRRGWGGLVNLIPDKNADNTENIRKLSADVVNRASRTGGTFLHSSRTNPAKLTKASVPDHLKDKYTDDTNDVTADMLKNLEFLGIDYLIPIGGDDTLSYGHRLHKEGIKVVAIPKTMDNDVPGTDYCIGFSTCITRTIELTHMLRTPAGSHERFLVIEAFGRYAGFSTLLPTMAGAADRCVIPEHPFDMELLTDLLSSDRRNNPSNYSVVLVSEGAKMKGQGEMSFEGEETDMFGHKKLGGIGDKVASELKRLSPKYNNGRTVEVINQKLSYMVRSGHPDALDSIIPMAYGNIALDLLLSNESGRLVCVKNGVYDNVDLDILKSGEKTVNIEKYYNTERMRPKFESSFSKQPFLIMASGK
ncbi:MAG: 6-phosphofructokinase [Bacteroidetes bacterium]|nr:6-phosphofructokinase [Bacteroidota bacterium]MDA1120259.1 6-phosphofructokinase [Bacteroidota bacterium]